MAEHVSQRNSHSSRQDAALGLTNRIHPQRVQSRSLSWLQPGSWTRTLVIALALAVLVPGAIFLQPAPAQAALNPQSQQVFSSAKGSDWVVPGNVTSVYVGIRGGNGGTSGSPSAASAPGGQGKIIVLRLAVTPGDKITTHSGQSASGNGNTRTGGEGYANGGNGGDKSLDGKVGGGGGGSSAVLLNGQLIAVAGGGGGAGGNGGKGVSHGGGGAAGTVGSFEAGPTAGGGKKGGKAGANSNNNEARGSNGGGAGNASAGGGGGAGGGGYAHGGTGGSGAGRTLTLTSNSGGGGGGAGDSFVASTYRTGNVTRTVERVTEAEQAPNNFDAYRGPVPRVGNSAITVISEQVSLEIIGAKKATEHEFFEFALNTKFVGSSSRYPYPQGKYTVSLNGKELASLKNWGDSRMTSTVGVYVGDTYVNREGLPAGIYEYQIAFSMNTSKEDFLYPEEITTTTHQVRVVPKFEGSVDIAGYPAPGETLTAVVTLPDPQLTGKLSYHWHKKTTSQTTKIAETTTPQYTVRDSDQGGEIFVKVYAENYGNEIQSQRYYVLEREVLTRLIAELPTAITTEDQANRVAALSTRFHRMSSWDQSHTANTPKLLATAEQQAGAVNHSVGLPDGWQLQSDSLPWYVRVLAQPIAANSAEYQEISTAAQGTQITQPWSLQLVDTRTGEALTRATQFAAKLTVVAEPSLSESARLLRVDGQQLIGVPTSQLALPPNSFEFQITESALFVYVDDKTNAEGTLPSHMSTHTESETGTGTGTDTDGDGVPNQRDLDIDGDGIANLIDPDIDGDGIPNALDDDANGDGTLDALAWNTVVG